MADDDDKILPALDPATKSDTLTHCLLRLAPQSFLGVLDGFPEKYFVPGLFRQPLGGTLSMTCSSSRRAPCFRAMKAALLRAISDFSERSLAARMTPGCAMAEESFLQITLQ